MDINIVKLADSSENLIAIGWLAKTSYLGSIYDRSVKGIRLRKGNILIGDHQTLNVVFKDARFNGWSIGEIFAVDSKLIPNARRDNFEKNPSYFLLVEQLTTIASSITKDIRSASLNRNADLSNALAQYEKVQRDTTSALNDGVAGTQKDALKQALSGVQTSITKSHSNGESDDLCKEIAFEELDMLIGQVQGATTFKVLNAMKNISNAEKKTLEKVFNAIIEYNKETSTQIIDYILSKYQQGGETIK